MKMNTITYQPSWVSNEWLAQAEKELQLLPARLQPRGCGPCLRAAASPSSCMLCYFRGLQNVCRTEYTMAFTFK